MEEESQTPAWLIERKKSKKGNTEAAEVPHGSHGGLGPTSLASLIFTDQNQGLTPPQARLCSVHIPTARIIPIPIPVPSSFPENSFCWTGPLPWRRTSCFQVLPLQLHKTPYHVEQQHLLNASFSYQQSMALKSFQCFSSFPLTQSVNSIN